MNERLEKRKRGGVEDEDEVVMDIKKARKSPDQKIRG